MRPRVDRHPRADGRREARIRDLRSAETCLSIRSRRRIERLSRYRVVVQFGAARGARPQREADPPPGAERPPGRRPSRRLRGRPGAPRGRADGSAPRCSPAAKVRLLAGRAACAWWASDRGGHRSESTSSYRHSSAAPGPASAFIARRFGPDETTVRGRQSPSSARLERSSTSPQEVNGRPARASPERGAGPAAAGSALARRARSIAIPGRRGIRRRARGARALRRRPDADAGADLEETASRRDRSLRAAAAARSTGPSATGAGTFRVDFASGRSRASSSRLDAWSDAFEPPVRWSSRPSTRPGAADRRLAPEPDRRGTTSDRRREVSRLSFRLLLEAAAASRRRGRDRPPGRVTSRACADQINAATPPSRSTSAT